MRSKEILCSVIGRWLNKNNTRKKFSPAFMEIALQDVVAVLLERQHQQNNSESRQAMGN
jgi:hypothetical protein